MSILGWETENTSEGLRGWLSAGSALRLFSIIWPLYSVSLQLQWEHGLSVFQPKESRKSSESSLVSYWSHSSASLQCLLLTSEQSREPGSRRLTQICSRLMKDWKRGKMQFHRNITEPERGAGGIPLTGVNLGCCQCDALCSLFTWPWAFQYSRLGSIRKTNKFTSQKRNDQ